QCDITSWTPLNSGGRVEDDPDRARGADMPDTDTTTPSTDPSDLLDLAGLLSETELEIRERVRAFVDAKIRPHIADWDENAGFPTQHLCDQGHPDPLGIPL